METLDRFIEAQRTDYGIALGEIRDGRKRRHWIWYIFPQLKGLGVSYNSEYYGISGLEEAGRYLSHPILGMRLREITGVLLSLEGRDVFEIFPYVDALKVHSCMTLFDAVSPNDVFNRVLDKYYGGNRDALTLEIIHTNHP